MERRHKVPTLRPAIILYGILLGSVLISSVTGTSQHKRDADPTGTQARIITMGGNLIFQTGTNHNITFRPGGSGSVVVDGEDLRQLITVAKENRARIDQLQTGASQNVESRLRSLEDGNTGINGRLTDLTNRVSQLENALTSDGRRLSDRVATLESQVQQLNALLTTNECQSNPCRHGGTCVDLFNGFSCRCTTKWTGVTCETDVNECAIYTGTDLGCQNGATCQNSDGDFSCVCPPNFFGIRCTETHDDCTAASNEALCGHGTCQNVARVAAGQAKYRCMCNVGWTTNGVTPECNTDVNECLEARPPCSTSPTVLCINTPGSFVCGPCPTGFVGNGYVCNDLNECEINNGGCSMAPRVRCINTVGSRTCDVCPQGYQGDGITCSYIGICGQNNGGCHPMATCFESHGFQGRGCTCRPGYMGDGIGASGCIPSAGPCANNPCVNGACQPSGASYICTCNPGWSGLNCNQRVDGCGSNPCRNGGTCVGRPDGSFTCTCTAEYTGSTCQDSQQTCGGRLTGESGSFRYPRLSSETYPHGVSCAWVITTSPSKVLVLTFPLFKLESSPNCNFDFLQIHDGQAASSHMIGKYCGSSPPNGGTINTTSYQVYLWFRSDASESGDGLEVVWNSAQPTCGGNLQGGHGVISSPGYPGNYPENRDCAWTVSVSPGQKIRFSFGQLALERHTNCSYDYLEIRDGLQESDPLLNRYCNISQPRPLDTNGPYAFLRFHSDDSQSDRGFQISYSTIEAVGCGGTFTDDNGILISPNYPNPYPHNAQCFWTISVPQGEVITFTITNIDLEVHGNCMWDFVEVRDGLDERGSFLGRFCGNSTPPVYRTTGNNLWIKFKSDYSNRGSGFRATWFVACGGNFTNATGELRSPFFPNPYPNDKECIYVIRQPEDTTITLTIISFDIEASGSQSDCAYDFLEVRSGQSSDGRLIGKYCGSSIPAPIQSRESSLWLKFKSDGSQQNHGFRATYTTSTGGTVAGSECGGFRNALSGMIQSPRHPNVYPHGVNCTWSITVTPGLVIRLTFITFSLESHYNCVYDYVQVFDNYTVTSSLGRFCGSDHPPVLTSSDNVMTISFVTDSSVAREGFHASYVSLNASSICGGDLRTEVGMLTSPNYPGNYLHNRQCRWTITVPVGRQILLNITEFTMEQHTNCIYDFLEIRDGGFETSPLIGKYCGSTIERVIRSQSNRLFLRMQTDFSVSHRGFRIFYDGTLSGCGGELTLASGSFVSPNYPMAYSRNAECFWQITVALGSTVNLHFADFNLASYYSCYYEYVEVRDTGPLGQSLGRFCGNTVPDYVQSRTNKMWIKFRTGYSNAGRGFHALYYANCNTRIRSHSGIIESPNFPRPYPANRDCTWVIEATLGNKVNASFSHFEVQPGRNDMSCTNDYLELRDGENAQGNLLGHLCGQNSLPADVSTRSRFLYIRFVSDSSVSQNGFRIEYDMDGCGGQYTSSTGGFTSPNYPQHYPDRRECIWSISTEPSSRIEFTIHDFDLEAHENCSFDVLEVYGGIDTTSPRLTQLCHTQSSAQIVTSTGNNMVVRFVSDYGQSGRGFNATYRSISGGCGGNFTARTGVIMSQNYPNTYPHYTDCLWSITVERGRPAVLIFEDFDLEGPSTGSSACPFDYVAVYETMDFDSSLLRRACGSSIPSPSVIRSSSNQMFIRMRSDGSVTSRGFKATYKAGCGGTLSAETDGLLTSPGWPVRYEILNNCSWLIQGNHTGDRVTLTFLHVDLENNYNNCSDDYVRVLEGNDLDAPEIGRYCGTTAPPPITSVGSALTVQFVTDASHQRLGFQAVYTKSTSACGGDFTSEHGAFNSPRYPDSYPINVECVWTITSSDGNSLMLSFSFFNIEPSLYCNNDYLEVRQGDSGGRVIGRYCGNQIPTNLTSGNRLWMKFKSNENVPGQGFMATYNSIFGGELNGNMGQLSSPLYPNNYPLLVHYTWVITVDLGLRIFATFQDMALELQQTCYFDYVRLRDGNNADSPELGRYCGVTVPQPVSTSSNQLRVEFHSDSSVNGRGFRMTWQSYNGTVLPEVSTPATPVGQRCSYALNATETWQTIESPGFPEPYADSLYCSWYISTSLDSSVLFQFNNLSLPGQTPRCYDAVSIQLGMSGYFSIRPSYFPFCGTVVPTTPTIIRANSAVVRFRTLPGRNSERSFIGFSLSYKSVCGGSIFGQRQGSIKSPSYPSNYPNDANCTWTVTVIPGRTIRSLFSGTFGVYGQTGQCAGDYIEVFNGRDASSPSLGRFCGNRAPTIPVSSSNSLTIVFISNSDGNSLSGFNFSFSDVQIACGGSVRLTETVTEGFIASPNYPQPYPQSVDCIWIITGPANRRVRVDFAGQFDIESHYRCYFDFVELRDGGTSNSPLLGSFCGSVLPSTQEATGNVMYARFRTDSSVARPGFRARVSYDICGGSISATNGSVISPNYPANYPSNLDCEWFIQGPAGHYLAFSFQSFNLEYSQNCTADFVEVRELNSTGTVLLGRSCGASRITVIDTSDRYAYVKFHSNNQRTFTGFKLNFMSSVEACGGQLTTPYGTITSPGYPRAYAHSRVCEWVIHVPEGRKVTLVFNDMDIAGYPSYCGSDYVEVRNGFIPMSPMIGRFCGRSRPTRPVDSSSNSMTVKFVTDANYNGRGFSATYSSNSPSECGDTLNGTESSGIIESPGFSNNISYNASEQCIWVISNRNQNSSTAIRFLTLDLEAQGECLFDFVEIREGVDESGELIGRFCRFDRGVRPVVLSPLPALWIRFVSDAVMHRAGFQLSYTFTGCGGLLTSSNGVITSPNFPSNYTPDTYCIWKIAAPESSQIKIRFDRINFGPSNDPNCSVISLEVFNGGLPSSPSAGRYCTGTPSIFKSQSNEVRVVFSATSGALPARGFRLSYTFESGGCGGSIHSQTGVVTSPNWPSNYNASLECIWDVTVEAGYHITWQFSPPFDLEISNPCSGDFVEVSEPRSAGPPVIIGRYCGNNIPTSGSSGGNTIIIKFRSNAQNQGSGFALNFTAGCGATFTERQGVIMSPGYPNNYANNLNCTYEIVGDPQKYLSLTFDPSQFFVEGWRSYRLNNRGYNRWMFFPWGRSRCFFDAVEVFSIINSTARQIGVFCGSTAPQPVGSFGGLRIRFTTDEMQTDRGWVATYEQSECGGRMTDPDGTITSPSHPQRYISNANCTWVITVARNKIIKLRFQTFRLEAHSLCNYDYVAIYDGSTVDPSRLIGKYCGSMVPLPLTSTGNSMLINFISDDSTQREGFSATYNGLYGPSVGCGGVINSTSGYIRSLDINRNGLYENDLECVWQIIVPQNLSIFLQYNQFNLVSAGCYDFLEVRDGLFETDPLVQRFCGGATPVNFTSATNMLYIKFVTDSTSAASGFTLRFTGVPLLCGTTFYSADASQVLTSPNYPLPYSPNLDCRWTIDAPEDEHVEITVTTLDIDNSTNCDNGHLEIRNFGVDPALAQRGFSTQPITVCGSTIPHPFISFSRTAIVKFVTTEVDPGQRTGFRLNYKTASCNRTYNASSGWLTSPKYPANYPVNANCHTVIQAPSGFKLSIFFAFVDIERNRRCQLDYLRIYNGSQTTSPVLATLCGSSTPSPIFFRRNEARLVFVTDGSTTRRGFALTYTASESGCGGALTNPQGVFTSPEYPRNIGYATVCQWSIVVSPRATVNFEITVQRSRGGTAANDCTNSRVNVYDGPTTSSPSVMYCTAEGQVNFRASSSSILVVFRSSNSTTASNIAFQARYTS